MHGRIPRLVLVAPIVAVLALTVMASHIAALGGAETPALKSISSRLDGTVSTVLIEASEPVAYLTSQPDPLTVLVDRFHPTVRSGEWPPVFRDPRAFSHSVLGHLVFGATLGALTSTSAANR